MKLYLDDIRHPHQTYPNDSDWFVVRNYNEFVSAIEKHFSDLEIISFDTLIDDYYVESFTGSYLKITHDTFADWLGK